MWTIVCKCACFGWDKINFLHCSWYELCLGFMLNRGLIKYVLVTAIPAASRRQVHKMLRGDTAGRDDLKWPKGCSIPWGINLNISEDRDSWLWATAQALAGHHSNGEWWWTTVNCFSFFLVKVVYFFVCLFFFFWLLFFP